MEKINLLSIPVSIGFYKEFVTTIMNTAQSNQSQYACIANVHMLVEAYRSTDFAKVVKSASVVTPDGQPLAWALRILHGIKQDRVAGMDLLPDLLSEAEAKKVPVFFYGSQQPVLNQTHQYLQKNYPDLIIAGLYSPPYRPLSEEEEKEIVSSINSSGAKLVFVILGCPKQEKWMSSMNGRIHATMVGMGGALPVMLGIQKRAPYWMQRSGLEWVYRLFQEPGRLFRRYAVTNTTFIVLLLKAYLRTKLFGKGFS